MNQSFEDDIRLLGIVCLNKLSSAAIYGMDTGASNRLPAGAILIREDDSEHIQKIVSLANFHKVSLWPISGGRNFGYGTSLPVSEDSYILDLSALKAISIDRQSGIATMQPGVTQEDLYKAIQQCGDEFLVPTTGVGHNGNIIGNALDGGYGLTPMVDHFEALSEVRGYWGNGVPFQHIYTDLGCDEMAGRWKPGTGANWSGILRQGNFGIVTQAKVQLVRKPEATRILIFEWKTSNDFFQSQPALARISEEMPGIGGIMMMNHARVLSTQLDTPLVSPLKGEQRYEYFRKIAAERKISAWTGIGTLYGSRDLVKGAVRDIRRKLPGCKVWSFTVDEIRFLKKLESMMPKLGFKALRRHLGMLVNSIGTVEGYPIVAFLKIAYSLKPEVKQLTVAAHPAKDECGILWYAPMLPLDCTNVKHYCMIMSDCLTRHGFDPLLAVTTRSSRALCGTIPVIFNKNDESAVARAKACYSDLVRTGLAAGYPPYRIGIDYMRELRGEDPSLNDYIHIRLKLAFDENDVIAPGRYSRSKQ